MELTTKQCSMLCSLDERQRPEDRTTYQLVAVLYARPALGVHKQYPQKYCLPTHRVLRSLEEAGLVRSGFVDIGASRRQ